MSRLGKSFKNRILKQSLALLLTGSMVMSGVPVSAAEEVPEVEESVETNTETATEDAVEDNRGNGNGFRTGNGDRFFGGNNNYGNNGA